MRILFLGDVVGRTGREAVADHLPNLRRQLSVDFVVANGENAAGGFGITEKIVGELEEYGVDVITTGNHVWDQRETEVTIDRMSAVLRPINFPVGTPGRGSGLFEVPGQSDKRVYVMNAMGRLFMDALDDPFAVVDEVLQSDPQVQMADAIVMDFHGEATSEKMAFGHFLDGRVNLVVGTHTHVPTSDAHILRGGTAYMTDAGMCGDYDSVIGMDKDEPINRFTRKVSRGRLVVAEGEGTLSGVIIETADKLKTERVAPVRVGGQLQETMPDW